MIALAILGGLVAIAAAVTLALALATAAAATPWWESVDLAISALPASAVDTQSDKR